MFKSVKELMLDGSTENESRANNLNTETDGTDLFIEKWNVWIEWTSMNGWLLSAQKFFWCVGDHLRSTAVSPGWVSIYFVFNFWEMTLKGTVAVGHQLKWPNYLSLAQKCI